MVIFQPHAYATPTSQNSTSRVPGVGFFTLIQGISTATYLTLPRLPNRPIGPEPFQYPIVAIYIHRATSPNVLLTFVFICYTHTNDKAPYQGIGIAPHILARSSLVEESILSRGRFVSYRRPNKLLWSRWRDLNSQSFRPMILSHRCIPFQHTWIYEPAYIVRETVL